MVPLPPLRSPGLFVTGTGTDVGKTAVCCAIAAAWRRQRTGLRLGVCKPFGSGCTENAAGELVCDDAERLAAAAGCTAPRAVVSPLRWAAPLAPAAAAARAGRPVNWRAVTDALATLDRGHDAVLVEGVGGVRVPLDPAAPRFMVAEFAAAAGLPVLVVADAGLGTLNHTLLTLDCLTAAGCRTAGVVLNDPRPADADADPSRADNATWLERLGQTRVLATVPCGDAAAREAAVAGVDWGAVAGGAVAGGAVAGGALAGRD